MKRVLAFLLAVSMLFSLTLPAYAEEVVEEIAEEIPEEIVEEVIEEVTEESEEPEEVEESAAEIPEEVAEEIVEEVAAAVASDDVAGSVAEPANVVYAPEDLCPWCNDGETKVKECHNDEHWGPFTLWLDMPNKGILRSAPVFVGKPVTTRLLLGNMSYRDVLDSAEHIQTGYVNEQGVFVETDAISISKAAESSEFTITASQSGTYLIRYHEELADGSVITHDVKIRSLGSGEKLFYATRADGTGFYSAMDYCGMWQDPFQPGYTGFDYRMYLETANSVQIIPPESLFTTADQISITAKEDHVAHVQMSAMIDGKIGFVEWNGDECKIHTMPVGYDGPGAPVDNDADIYFRVADTEKLLTSIELEKEVPVTGEFLYGSTGAYIPLPRFDRIENGGFNIDPCEGMSKLTGFFLGAQVTIYFADASFKATVPNPNAGDAVESTIKKLFVTNPSSSGNTIHTHWDLSLNPENPNWSAEYGRMIYFGTSESDKILAKGVRIVAGDSIELTERQNDYKFVAKKTGYTILAYTDPQTQLEYYFPVNVNVGGNNTNKMARNYVPLGNITSGMGLTGWAGMETLDYFSQIGNYYVPGSSDPFACTLGLLVRENEQYVDFTRLSDVTFELMGCNVQGAITLGEMFTYTEEGRFSTYAVRVSGRANTTYQGTVAVSYTLDGTKRFTHQINLFRNPNFAEVEIFATEDNLGTAGQLNVVLSSWEAFTAWVKDTQDIDLVPGMPVTLHLPAVSYNDVIVAQSMSPVNRNNAQPITLIKLWGARGEENGARTQMCGLIEKASLVGIGFIDFVAIKGKSVTTTGEKKAFTCGILADYKNSFEPVYDQTYLNKYCNGQKPSLELPADRIEDYGNIFNTTIDLGQVHDCLFEGFDYGTRSTPYGFIGSQQHDVYRNNYYGIYMDNDGSGISGGDDSADAGNATATDYTQLTFENNEYAVRMVSIPCDASPYRVRVHDSNFIDNFREFWIDEPGIFYFYRNYFAGKWQENDNHHGDWTEYKDVLPSFDERDAFIEHYYIISEHRPGRVHFDKGDPSKAETLVIINPCRSTPDFEEKIYWFYGGEDQLTVIEQGNEMLLSGDAVEQLKEDADVSVVNSSGETMITYTFQGKGEDQT